MESDPTQRLPGTMQFNLRGEISAPGPATRQAAPVQEAILFQLSVEINLGLRAQDENQEHFGYRERTMRRDRREIGHRIRSRPRSPSGQG